MSNEFHDQAASEPAGEISHAEQLTHYREYAAQIRDLAESEPDRALRGRLLALYRRYDAIARRLEAKG